MAWELFEGGGLGLVHLCVPFGAKSRVGAPERCLKFSGEGRPFDTDDTPAVGLLPFPWHLVLGDRSEVPLVLQGLRFLPAEAAACRGPAQELGNPPLLPPLQSLASAPPTGPLGREQAGLFSLSLHLNPTPNLTINVCVLRLHFLW